MEKITSGEMDKLASIVLDRDVGYTSTVGTHPIFKKIVVVLKENNLIQEHVDSNNIVWYNVNREPVRAQDIDKNYIKNILKFISHHLGHFEMLTEEMFSELLNLARFYEVNTFLTLADMIRIKNSVLSRRNK